MFVTARSRLYEKRKSELLLKLHCVASERCFLVELKRNYAGNKLKKLLCKIFNSMCILVIMVCSNSGATLKAGTVEWRNVGMVENDPKS